MYTPQETNFLQRINKYLSHFDWPLRAQTPRVATEYCQPHVRMDVWRCMRVLVLVRKLRGLNKKVGLMSRL
jgi:hypothetical protein